jgi:RNA polymerase sigma-70 factor, ECF subfamily
MKVNHDAAAPNAIQYIDALYGYAMILTLNDVAAQGLAEETYLRAVPSTNRVCPERKLKGWLFAILRSGWLSHVRRQVTKLLVRGIDVANGVPDGTVKSTNYPRNVLTYEMGIEQVRAAVERLSVELREIILLREYEDLSYSEIADVLDCPMGTVMLRLGRAHSRLRLLLSKTFQRLEAKCERG